MESEEGPSDTSSESMFGFNRKRAEGRDGNSSPKRNLQVKLRKLNPVNTICYVQVTFLIFCSLFPWFLICM